jgi:hypothetical protein
VTDVCHPSADATVVFLHIGKTAGSSVRKVLFRNVPDDRVVWIRQPRERPHGFLGDHVMRDLAALDEEERRRARLVVGHMYFGVHELIPGECVYFTMLRDPVSRAVSQYAHVLRRTNHRFHELVNAEGMGLSEYITSGVATETDNSQTRAIAGDVTTPFGACTPEMLERAKANIDRHFALVGLVERFDETLVQLQSTFGWNRLRNVRANVAPRSQRPEVTEFDCDVIREQNRLDVELYAYAADRFQQGIIDDPSFEARLRRYRRANALYQPWGRMRYRARREVVFFVKRRRGRRVHP